MPASLGHSMKEATSELGKFVRSRRLALNLTQNDLATKMGISTSIVTEIERGNYKTLQSKRVAQLVDVLNCTNEEITNLFIKSRAKEWKGAGKLLNDLCASKNRSLDEVLKNIGWNVKRVSSFKSRGGQAISSKIAKKIAEKLNCPISEFAPILNVGKVSPNTNMGKIIREYRIKKGLSAWGVARILQITRQAMNGIESGKYPGSLKIRLKLMEILEIPIDVCPEMAKETVRRQYKKRKNNPRIFSQE